MKQVLNCANNGCHATVRPGYSILLRCCTSRRLGLSVGCNPEMLENLSSAEAKAKITPGRILRDVKFLVLDFQLRQNAVGLTNIIWNAPWA